MGYTKQWTPPVVVVRDNLTVWKALFNDIRINLLAAGLIQTSDPEQLVIDDVEELPLDGEFAGYQVYQFDDALHSTCPVYIKLEFGCGIEEVSGSNNSRTTRTPIIRASFSGDLDLEYTNTPINWNPGQSTSGVSLAEHNTIPGESYIVNNPTKGFFGVFYGLGGRRLDPNNRRTGSLIFVVQRSLVSGNFDVWFPRTANNSLTQTPRYYHIRSGDLTSYLGVSSFLRPLAELSGTAAPQPQLHPIAKLDEDGVIGWCPNMFTFETSDIGHGHIFEASPAAGIPPSTFIGLHPDGIHIYDPMYDQPGLAILWE